MAKVSPEFAKKVKVSEKFNAEDCMHCGTCTAVCPMGEEILPRKLFRYAMLGLEDKVIDEIPAIFSCLLCRMCQQQCPADVKIADNVRFLRDYINKNEFEIK